LPQQGEDQEVSTKPMENCSICKTAVHGDFVVLAESQPDESFIIEIDSTPDRNFNVCDLCNEVICFACSRDKDSGYCNVCLYKVFPERLGETNVAAK
jgi:hypothetical protein